MLKAFVRLALGALALLLITAVAAVWAMGPRHFPGSVRCRQADQPRLQYFSKPGMVSLFVNDCLLTSGRNAEIRAWYNAAPFAPIAGLEGFPRWSTGRLSFTIYQSLSLEPARLHLASGETGGGLNTAIVTQTSYSFSW
jgi:hypothetical protein